MDIAAYSQVAFKRLWADDEALYELELVPVHPHYFRDFPTHPSPLKEGWYEVQGEACAFRAGSYSRYNAWRAWLCEKALGVDPAIVWKSLADGEATYEGKPFVGLINFTDCDGVIGSELAAKLHSVFVEMRHMFAEDGEEYYMSLYDNFTEAFGLAADSGMVVFQ